MGANCCAAKARDVARREEQGLTGGTRGFIESIIWPPLSSRGVGYAIGHLAAEIGDVRDPTLLDSSKRWWRRLQRSSSGDSGGAAPGLA
jgi:hypothetical protein